MPQQEKFDIIFNLRSILLGIGFSPVRLQWPENASSNSFINVLSHLKLFFDSENKVCVNLGVSTNFE